jgi:fibro-slime domain-containing protein
MRGALGLWLVVGVLASACAATHGDAPDAGAGSAGAIGGSGASGSGGQAGVLVLPQIPDDGYTVPTTSGEQGGYQLGDEIPVAVAANQGTPSADSSTGCQKLLGIVRDFKGALPAWGGTLQPGGHPDFEVFQGDSATNGLVKSDLARDGKPIYNSVCELGAPVSPGVCPFGAMTTSADNFGQWYHSIEGVNRTYYVYFQLADPVGGVSTFSSLHFFPLDNAGWGNSGIDFYDPKTMRNYSFTTEIHTRFRYDAGQTFTFIGDDDVWIFINGKLAVDLGGLHTKIQGSVDLDQAAAGLGLVQGMSYNLDLFHAERHSVSSNFRIDTNFAFSDCGYIVP